MKPFVNAILNGDSLNVLKTIPNACVDMTMTSPPYWALRDYGVNGQIGLEHRIDEYIHHLCDIFDEVWRVTKQHGTCWVNLGDTYSNSKDKKTNLAAKSLAMIPFRFAIEMVNRGWILRNTIIWHKPNCMPSSAKDRFTVDFEYLFFFSKSKTYFFDQNAVRIPYDKKQKLAGIERAKKYGYNGKDSYQHWYFNKRQGKDWVNKKETKDALTFGQAKRNSTTKPPNLIHPQGRNRRCIWTIPNRPYKDAHFATYPENLCVVPIQAGCAKGGIVLDPFSGSGTTLKVAQELERNYIGIELNPDYIELAKKRLSEIQELKTDIPHKTCRITRSKKITHRTPRTNASCKATPKRGCSKIIGRSK